MFLLWARLSTLTPGEPIWVPLRANPRFEARDGQRALTVQVNDREGALQFGLLTDVSAAFARSRAAYAPKVDAIGLDLGLRTLFATDRGDLLGRDWMDRLLRMDRQITRLAAHRQRIGLRKVKSPRYQRLVRRLNRYIESEVGRILNRLVEVRAPGEIVVEHLRFRNLDLSRRLNRLLGWFGKAAVQRKLQDLHERLGITTVEVNAAYSSQECSVCGYVDKRNRPRQATFACRGCGHTRHADVNGARIVRHRRSVPVLGDLKRHRREVLEVLVRRYVQRFTRLRAGPADPRLTNPYFRDWVASAK